jgi:hypothetical protein
MEYAGLSRLLERTLFPKEKTLALHETGYYGKLLEQDPYEELGVQHLHPYYIFSLPWRPDDIAAVNSEFVTIDATGFRNSGVDEAEADAILLGGSTAFGHKSSSDAHTLAWRLTEVVGLKFANRNAPSWNSHQELVAAAKFPHRYRLSLSFSLVNDIKTYCFEAGESPFHDQPESFDQLAQAINDIRGQPVDVPSDESLLQRIVPRTYSLAARLLGSGPAPEEKLEKRVGRFCTAQPIDVAAREIARSFLRNQQQIAGLAVANGGKHLVVLQPSRQFYRDAPDTPLFRLVYDLVMSDPWCATRCVDFSRIPGLDPAIFYDGSNSEAAHFADPVHLTDKGVEAVVAALAPILRSAAAKAP